MLGILFLLGFFFSFVGSITPSMLNITVLKISLEKGSKAANLFALGIAVFVIPQIYIAVFLTKYITENPSILKTLDKAGVVIFIFLSFYFYRESKKRKLQLESVKTRKENPFFSGIILSVLNMFSIPFFCGIILLLDTYNFFTYDFLGILFFVFGSFMGTFYILFLYGKYAKSIQQKTGKLTRDINLILSILTGLVAFFTIIKLSI